MTIKDFCIRILVSVLVGCMVGFERQWINRTAGMQTNALVCVGACIFLLGSDFMQNEGQSHSRIAAQIVSGIGFLGAGMIFKEGFNAHGINTAATIWCSAGLGILIGIGQIPLALIGSIALVVMNIVIRKTDHLIASKRKHLDKRIAYNYNIKITCKKERSSSMRENIFETINKDETTHITGVKTNWKKNDNCEFEIFISSHHIGKSWIQKISDDLSKIEGSLGVNWRQK